MKATIRPVEIPVWTPLTITVPQFLRPVTRSTDLRSVPTIATFSTGNFASARKSTAACACG